MRKFKVAKTGVGQRTDVFVAGKFPKFARSALSCLFDEKLVKIGAKPAKASYKLRRGDQLQIDDSLLKTQPRPIKLPILYEDAAVVVINKPAGILTHSKGALNTEATVASFLKSKITDKNLVGNRAGIVHRLDRATSGVIIGAKTEATLKWLQKQFASQKTKKTYLAIVEKVPKVEAATIDAPIARNPARPQTFKVSSLGKAAQTNYEVLKTFSNHGKTYSLLRLQPRTGRTHQLRIHLAYIGNPIVGDWVYGHEGKHLLLHASALELTLPDKSHRTFSAPLPAYFNKFEKGELNA